MPFDDSATLEEMNETIFQEVNGINQTFHINTNDPDFDLLAEFIEWTQDRKFVVPMFYVLFLICNFFGNGLLVTVVALNRSMWNTTNLILANISSAELVISYMGTISTISLIQEHWGFGSDTCRLMMYSVTVAPYIISYGLVVLVADRYLAIRFPNIIVKRRNVVALMLAMWLGFLFACFPMAVVSKINILYSNKFSKHVACGFDLDHPWLDFHAMTAASMVTTYVIPVFVCTTLFVLILLHQRCNPKPTGNSITQVTRMVGTLASIFILLHFPVSLHKLLQVANVFYDFHIRSPYASWVFSVICHILTALVGVLTPIVYFAMTPQAMQEAKHLLTCSALRGYARFDDPKKRSNSTDEELDTTFPNSNNVAV